jgi:hypothetical protein
MVAHKDQRWRVCEATYRLRLFHGNAEGLDTLDLKKARPLVNYLMASDFRIDDHPRSRRPPMKLLGFTLRRFLSARRPAAIRASIRHSSNIELLHLKNNLGARDQALPGVRQSSRHAKTAGSTRLTQTIATASARETGALAVREIRRRASRPRKVVRAGGGAVTWRDRYCCARVVDVFEKALMRQNGNRLPKELEAKLAEISKLAASRRRERRE